MGKFTSAERTLIKSIVAALTIKRIPEPEIINEIYNQTNKSISKVALFKIKKRIKNESYHWYQTLREGQYEYVHEFKERIDEILWLQRKHHEIIDSPTESTSNKQASLAELHKLNITLSNYFDVAPDIIGHTIPAPPEAAQTRKTNYNIIV